MSTIRATNFQHASAANPALVLAADGSATANVSAINGGPLAGFRNAIINGNFDIWQRGTSFSNPTSGAYLADRWLHGFDGSGATRTLSRQAFALGQADVPNEPSYFFRYNQSVAGTGATSGNLQHRIEGARAFAGQQVTVSFYAKAASAITLPEIVLVQNFGTGGTPSGFVTTTAVSSVAIGTSWAKYSYTATLPSIAGKTLGSDANDFLLISWRLPLNTTFTFDIAQVQVEPGPVATTFERRPIGTELALCQRYYERIQPRNSICYFQAANSVHVYVPWKETKRATPSIAFLSTTSNTIVFGSSSSTTFNGTYGIEGQDTYGSGINATTSTAVLTAGQTGRFQVIAIITADSEL